MLQYVLLGLGGASSTIAVWNNRLRKHLAGYGYWDVKQSLEDTFPTADSDMSLGLLISCAFDFGELIEGAIKDRVGTIQGANQSGHSPLHVAIRNESCASLASLLKLDQGYTEITVEIVVAAAKNYSSSKEVMTLLFDRRGDDV